MRDEFSFFYSKFKDISQDLGRKNTLKQEFLLKLLFVSNEHLSVSEIVWKLKKTYNITISDKAVYSLLDFLEEMSLVESISIEPNKTKKYQLNVKNHHDHLICIKCGKIVEFYDKIIESSQKEIFKKYEFEEISHTMILYGVCSECI